VRRRHGLPWKSGMLWHVLVLSWAEPVATLPTLHSPSALFMGRCYCQRNRRTTHRASERFRRAR